MPERAADLIARLPSCQVVLPTDAAQLQAAFPTADLISVFVPGAGGVFLLSTSNLLREGALDVSLQRVAQTPAGKVFRDRTPFRVNTAQDSPESESNRWALKLPANARSCTSLAYLPILAPTPADECRPRMGDRPVCGVMLLGFRGSNPETEREIAKAEAVVALLESRLLDEWQAMIVSINRFFLGPASGSQPARSPLRERVRSGGTKRPAAWEMVNGEWVHKSTAASSGAVGRMPHRMSEHRRQTAESAVNRIEYIETAPARSSSVPSTSAADAACSVKRGAVICLTASPCVAQTPSERCGNTSSAGPPSPSCQLDGGKTSAGKAASLARRHQKRQPFWLAFRDHALEAQYTVWHSIQQQQVDLHLLLMKIVITLVSLKLFPSAAFGPAFLLVVAVTLVTDSMLLYVTRCPPPWYLRHRDTLLCIWNVAVVSGQVFVGLPALTRAPALYPNIAAVQTWLCPPYFFALTLLHMVSGAACCLWFCQIRFRTLLPAQLLTTLIYFYTIPITCGLASTGSSLSAGCVVSWMAKIAAFMLVAPCLATYKCEQHSRRLFCQGLLQEREAVEGVEGGSS